MAGLRRYRNQQLLRIIWRDLIQLASLEETFSDLTSLAEVCLSAAIEENEKSLRETFGAPLGENDEPTYLFVIGLGKFGGGELNLSSDIDIIFCYGSNGQCVGGKRNISSEQYFIRLARAVIASLSEITEDGFCFRVDTRLRPFGDSGPLCSSQAAMEQYYQREGRDWERYALIYARTVAGEHSLGTALMERLKPFVYRRYIDFTAIEALQDMHDSVNQDARVRDRLSDIKRGPGGIREIEFLVQCFQLLRGGQEPGLQTPSLSQALASVADLGLLDEQTIADIRSDYLFLRQLENRIQALHDQQTHDLPAGDDLLRGVKAMGFDSSEKFINTLQRVRDRVSERFTSIFPKPAKTDAEPKWVEVWRQMQTDRQSISAAPEPQNNQPFATLLHKLDRQSLSQRAHLRLSQFMPVLLQRLDRM
jgi:glutamate-ammonia-ligase adenylyltransferase